jgi:hypothetical protein
VFIHTPFIIFLNFIAPAIRNGSVLTERSDRIAHHAKIELDALAVGVVVLSAVGSDAKAPCCFNRIDIRTEKNEFPTVACFLSFYQLPDMLR